MKPELIFNVMDLARNLRSNDDIFNPCFVSAPGLGKTEITQQWAKDNNLPCIVISLSTMEPPDFKGFPNISIKDNRQRMSFATPDFWPDSGEGVIILEELNRAPASIMQCLLSLLDIRRGFDGYKLPLGWMVVGCINPEGSEYDVNSMDYALKDRFEIFNVDYNKETFVNYMKDNSWDSTLMMFVQSNTWTYSEPESIAKTIGAKYLSPRTFSKINSVLQSEFSLTKELELITLKSVLGDNVGKAFYHFKYNEKPILFKDLLDSKRESLSMLKKYSDPKKLQNHLIAITVADVLEDNTISDELLADISMVLPVDHAVTLIRELEFKRKDDAILKRISENFPKVKALFKEVLKVGQ